MVRGAEKTLLELRNAGFGYERRLVVRGVDCVVRAGDFVGIAGPNGAGKTTLFRGMLGLIPTLEGTLDRNTRAIGYVPQRESLDAIYPLRVAEVVEMGAYGRLRGWRRLPQADRELAREKLAQVKMEEHSAAHFSHLSGGQRQRVLIARALMTHPEILLLDEPTSGVDREAQAEILALLADLNEKDGLAVLLVSHQLDMLRRAVRRLLIVADGRVRVGAPDDLVGDLETPPWVAGLSAPGQVP